MTNKSLIKITGSIIVNRNIDSVFNFFANPCNDKLWRKEINESTLDGTLKLGVSVFEYSYLSKKVPNNLLELKCVQYDKNKIAVFETLENAPFYEKSQRLVNVISENTTEIIYILDFDKNIVKHALGFSLPKFIISVKANSDMKKYLHQLKEKTENES